MKKGICHFRTRGRARLTAPASVAGATGIHADYTRPIQEQVSIQIVTCATENSCAFLIARTSIRNLPFGVKYGGLQRRPD